MAILAVILNSFASLFSHTQTTRIHPHSSPLTGMGKPNDCEIQRKKEQGSKAISADEEDLIVRLHKLVGDRWELIAGRLPWRTKEEIQEFWETRYTYHSSPSCNSSSSSITGMHGHHE